VIETMPNVGTTMSVETINPTTAQRYLNTAATNRRSRQGKIDQYARDMTAGRWHSSVLRFNEAGELVDGQHRLWAVVASGTEQSFYVERGLTPDAVRTLDQGLPRTAGDVLAILGEVNATNLGGAIRLARWFSLFPGLAPTSQSREPFSPDEMIDYLKANPGIRESVKLGKHRVNKAIPFSSSLAGAVHYLASRQNQAKADEFFEQLATGAQMVERTGPYMLRNAIITDRLKPREERMNPNAVAAITIKAWNAWLHDREIKVLRWVRGPQFSESFPRIGAEPSA
jgi:hypothetical protein